MITEFLTSNMQFILGLIATLVVWLIAKWTGAAVDKSKIIALLSLILEIIQDIKTNPATAELSKPEKKALAVAKIEALPAKQKNLAQKVFGSLGAAVEFVYHNRNALAVAAAAIIKKVL
ncbi:MAG: hypothetical protein M0Q16_09660 [Candidatus Cloacimonetes bacterium]|jgi:hypothetical protein|nr:hypothetical protein [Candidatus Cloacimonadota bacterium]